MVLQGHIQLVKKIKYYGIIAKHVYYNGDMITGDYEPVFLATKRLKRRILNIENVRGGIFPFSGKKIKDFI